MGKALMVIEPNTNFSNGVERPFGCYFDDATEGNTQVSFSEAADITNLLARTASGNSGTATYTVRKNAANGNNTCQLSGAGTTEDTTHTDSCAAGDLVNLSYTDTGTDSVNDICTINVGFASGHGCFHGAAVNNVIVCDVASSTRYFPISGGIASDGNQTKEHVQWKNRGYTSITAFQVRISANARSNNSVFSINVNGSDVGTAITFSAGETGLKTVTGLTINLNDGDLICITMTLGTGVEDLTVAFLFTTCKSSIEASELFCAGTGSGSALSRSGGSTPHYYVPGGNLASVEFGETSERVRPGFACRLGNLRCYLSANSYTGTGATEGTLKVFVDGVEKITVPITASGGAGWYENASSTYDITATESISFEMDEGASGLIDIRSIGITLYKIPSGAVQSEPGLHLIGQGRVGSQQGLSGIEQGTINRLAA